MKKILFTVMIIGLFTSCTSDDYLRDNNPNLVDLNVRWQISLDLPEYSALRFPGNSLTTYNRGIKGIVIYNVNGEHYSAFELSDPNHPPNDCSAMEVEGITARCSCEDGNEYNIITGELTKGEGAYAMRPYRVEFQGNTILISN